MLCEARSKSRRRSIVGGGVAGAAAGVFLLRKWQARWKATAEEVAAPMPLDEEVTHPTYVTNRAVTIRALPEQVWPWLAQMGESPRGGFYSYVSIERLLKMKVENADEILPEFQEPKVGDALDRAGSMLVRAVERNRHLVLGPRPTRDLAVTWTLALDRIDDGRTRLVSRCRARLPRGIRGLLASLVLDPGQFVMERKMLLEIKRRAEKLAARSHFEILPERRAG